MKPSFMETTPLLHSSILSYKHYYKFPTIPYKGSSYLCVLTISPNILALINNIQESRTKIHSVYTLVFRVLRILFNVGDISNDPRNIKFIEFQVLFHEKRKINKNKNEKGINTYNLSFKLENQIAHRNCLYYTYRKRKIATL